MSPTFKAKLCTLYLKPPIIPSGGPWAPNCSKVSSRRMMPPGTFPALPPLKPFFAHRQNPHLDELVQAIDARLRKSLVSVSK